MKCFSFVATILLLFCANSSVTFAQESTVSFIIKSVDDMKQTQDKICNPPSDTLIQEQMEFTSALGATHVAISTSYTDPPCGSSIDLTNRYVAAIRKANLNVWFRMKPSEWEGFDYTTKLTDPWPVIPMIGTYIREHAYLYQPGDILTPIPEPQNGGITDVNCSDNTCLFDGRDDFNNWLLAAVLEVQSALEDIGLKDKIIVGMFGFDGFIAVGIDNKDWTGVINTEVIAASNNTIAVDHYFSAEADPAWEFAQIRAQLFLNHKRDVYTCLGEWGSINGEGPERVREVLQAALDNGITCINWWHLGPEGVGEQLLDYKDGHLVPTENYYVVQEFFLR